MYDDDDDDAMISAFTYFPEPSILDVVPAESSLFGGIEVTVAIHGVDLSLYDHLSDIFCSFDGIIVTGTAKSWMTIECTAPPKDIPGLATLTVSLNGADFFSSSSSEPVIFNYVSSMYIVNLSPSHTSIGDSIASIEVTGFGFPDRSDMSCNFSDMVSSAVRLTSKTLLCPIPHFNNIGAYPFSVSVGTSGFVPTDIVFNVDAGFSIDSITPEYIAISQVDQLPYITLKGEGFWDFDELSCRIGSSITASVFVSGQEVLCVLPSSLTPGIVDVALTSNGFDFTSAGAIIVQYELMISSLLPALGPVTGYTPIEVTSAGTMGFQSDSQYLCHE